MNDKDKFEQEVADKLTAGEMEQVDPTKAARERLAAKTEIRIQAELDPIVEETRLFREMATEVDGRYDDYLARIPKKPDSADDAADVENDVNHGEEGNHGK